MGLRHSATDCAGGQYPRCTITAPVAVCGVNKKSYLHKVLAWLIVMKGNRSGCDVQTLHFYSFDNIWFWIVFILAWTISTHRVLGTPYYYWISAQRGNDDMRAFVSITAPRAARILIDNTQIKSPALVWGAIGFVGSCWGVSAFKYDHEFLQATFLLAIPLILVFPLRLSLARAISQCDNDFEVMYPIVRRYRRIHLIISAVVIFAVTLYGMFYNFLHSGVLI